MDKDVVPPIAPHLPTHPHPSWQQPEHRLHERLPRIAWRLRSAGIAEVRVEYEGHWGVAHTGLVSFHDKEQKPIEPTLPSDLTERIDECFRELLDVRYPRWANDAGSFGFFTWRLVEAALTHEHNTRHIIYRTEIHEGL